MSSNKPNRKNTPEKETSEMGKNKKTEFTVDDAAADVVSAFEKLIQTLVAKGGSGKVAASDDDEDVEEVEDEDEEEIELTREMVEEATENGIKALRELAAETLEDPPTKKADILAAFEELLEDEEDEEEEEDEDEEDEDEEDEESDEWDRDSLEELTLKELRKVAREDFELTTDDYKGLDQDALVDLLLGEEDEDDEDEEDEEEVEEDEDDEEVEELDEDALKAMTQKDLIGLAKEIDIKVPTKLKKQSKANKTALVALILESGEEEE